MSVSLPHWPGMMRRAYAAKYCDLTIPQFEREVSAGRLPSPVILGDSERWSKMGLDAALERIGSGEPDWFKGSPLYDQKVA